MEKSKSTKINDRISNQEMVALLNITNLISSSKSQYDLLKNINSTIKPLFDFIDFRLFVLNKDGKSYFDWSTMYSDLNSTERNDELCKLHYINGNQYLHENFPLENIVNKVDEINEPILFNFVDSFNDFATYHDFERVNILNCGYKDCLGYNLKDNGKNIGFFCLNSTSKNSFKESQFPLFKSISNIIANTLSNILSNQDMLEREQEKTNLLAISEALASVNNRIALKEVIYSKIKQLFPFDSVGLFILDEEADMIYEILHKKNDCKNAQSILNCDTKYGACKLSLSNSKSWWMNDDVTITSVRNEKNLSKNFVIYDQFKIEIENGLDQMIGSILLANGKKIGAISFSSKLSTAYSEAKIPLFKNICNQISVALSNVLAKENLLQLSNLKVLELALVNKLTSLNDWNERFLEFNRLLQPHISNSMLVINFEINENKCPLYAFFRTGANEYQILYKEDILRISKLDGATFLKIRSNLIKTYENPFILRGNSLLENNKNNRIKEQICLYFDFKSNLIFPLQLEKYGKIIFSFYGKEENSFSEKHVVLLKNLGNTLSLILDRILATEEIEKLNNQLEQENIYLQEEVNNKSNFENIIGSSSVLQEIFKNVDLVANTDTTVLVLGETGTGKELIARSLHNQSNRKNNSFIKVNCAALPAQLIESELFGHEKGSFTGAFEKRIGKFELADNGSIFLDEIGELPLELQSKLLRVIQEKEFERIGGKSTIKCNVRIIAATNRVLENEVEKGNFRADLYFRLNIFPIKLPPLRERLEDIPLLATYFGQKFSKKMNKPFKGIQPATMEALIEYNWPGNIRELENVMEQAVIVNQLGSSLELARQLFFAKQPNEFAISKSIENSRAIKSFKEVKKEKEIAERNAIINALTATKGRVRGLKGAALLLDIQPTSLESKMKKYGIFKDEFGILGQ